jgi:dihydrofolate synthase/folylpolyglutamate synthase
MLLVALAWFRERGVAHFVVEGGRGVRWDEVGRLPSKVGVVTSVFLEHAEYIGPGIADIAADKLSLIRNSDVAVVGPLARRFLDQGPPEAGSPEPGLPSPCARVQGPAAAGPVAGPRWLAEDAGLAAAAASAYLGRAVAVPARLPNLPSFGRGRLLAAAGPGIELVYEGLIAAVSFDAGFWAAELARAPAPLVLLSLPDDKDVRGVDAAFRALGAMPRHLVLTGERGRLSHAEAEALGTVAGTLRLDDAAGLADLLGSLAAEAGTDRVALAGTQTFLRLVKRAVALERTILPQHG